MSKWEQGAAAVRLTRRFLSHTVWPDHPNTTFLHHSKHDTLLLRGLKACHLVKEVLTTTLDYLP